MKKTILLPILALLLLILYQSCADRQQGTVRDNRLRPPVDTIGFAWKPWQMDSVMARNERQGWRKQAGLSWKLAICPHDDYTYVGSIYPELLQNVKASTVILIGVAHKAARLGIEDSLVFDSYSRWTGPWSDVPVSPLREELYGQLKNGYAIISDTLHKIEQSVESMIPFLQYFNKPVSIVPILVPAMSPDRMEKCGRALADAIRDVTTRRDWKWGSDYSIVVTTDAVHYGNEEWGGANYAPFGCDEKGNTRALQLEAEIMDNCLVGQVSRENIRLFSSYTLQPDNYKAYKWTWCGRYCVPVALYTAYFLNNSKPLDGQFIAYSTSITRQHVEVDDLGMGRTAIATPCHWVGYAALGYR